MPQSGSVGRRLIDVLGPQTRPVRVIMFDKTAEANWSVGWHQDRAIAVRQRHEVPGFGPWSIKSGVSHVEPPFEIIANMMTVRIHLDDCGDDNAPLLIAPGSHRLGRIPAASAADVAARLGQVSCHAQAGDLWLYATAIVHASKRAQRPLRRRVVQVDYANFDLPGGLVWLGIQQEFVSANAGAGA